MRIPPPARVLLALAAAHMCACAQGHIDVAVFNYAGAPHWMLASAMDTAMHALRTAHIDSKWVLCDDQDAVDLPAESSYRVFVMPRLRTPLTDHPHAHPAGFALEAVSAQPRAYVLYDAAVIVAGRTTRPLGEVLGCILLHELGHLLGLAHQPHGAMRPDLEGPDMDTTAMGRGFSPAEAAKLRAALRDR